MARDKQLSNVRLEEVLEKRRLDQALNTKEFAVLVGISYSAARAWFRMPRFPVIRGVVFWQDFVQWRDAQHSAASLVEPRSEAVAEAGAQGRCVGATGLSARAVELLADAG